MEKIDINKHDRRQDMREMSADIQEIKHELGGKMEETRQQVRRVEVEIDQMKEHTHKLDERLSAMETRPERARITVEERQQDIAARTYDGKEDPQTYLKQFEMVAASNRWNEKDLGLRLNMPLWEEEKK